MRVSDVLVVEQQRLVAGVEVDPVELVGVGADGLHEGQRALDLVGDRLIALAEGRALHEVGVPGVHLPQVGVTTGHERADQVERGRRGVVDVDEPLRVGDPRLRGEVVAVDRVAAVGRQGQPVAGLHVGAARLGVLAGEPAELHDRDRRGVRQHDRHLQQHAQLVADVVGGDSVERLGAVAALEQEGLAPGHGRDLVHEVVALPRKHERRRLLQPGHGSVDGAPVGVGRLLEGTERVQLLEGGDRAHPPRVRAGERGHPTPTGPRTSAVSDAAGAHPLRRRRGSRPRAYAVPPAFRSRRTGRDS